jgi:hypothetical protein
LKDKNPELNIHAKSEKIAEELENLLRAPIAKLRATVAGARTFSPIASALYKNDEKQNQFESGSDGK